MPKQLHQRLQLSTRTLYSLNQRSTLGRSELRRARVPMNSVRICSSGVRRENPWRVAGGLDSRASAEVVEFRDIAGSPITTITYDAVTLFVAILPVILACTQQFGFCPHPLDFCKNPIERFQKNVARTPAILIGNTLESTPEKPPSRLMSHKWGCQALFTN